MTDTRDHWDHTYRGRAGKVSWIVADITSWQPERSWDIWHDRAVFHFLTDRAAQDAYIAALMRATKAQSHIIMATFALHGPERGSGLPVQRYSAQTLAARLGPAFALYARRLNHIQRPSVRPRNSPTPPSSE